MIVVKIGGGAGIDPEPLVEELSTRSDWILVHGTSDEANRLSEALGVPPRFVTSLSGHVSRYTDERTLEILSMASSKQNLRIVGLLQSKGVRAVGVRGIDGGLVVGRRKEKIKVWENGRRVVLSGDHTGTIESVRTDLLEALLKGGFCPVLTLPIGDGRGQPLSADADRMAAAVASALKAEALVILTNVVGLLENPLDPTTLVLRLSSRELERAFEIAQGRFRKKILAAKEALEGGVGRVAIATANRPHPIEQALEGRECTVVEG